MFSVTKTSIYWFILSGLLVAGSVLLLFVWGIRLGIEFRGGSLSELEFSIPTEVQDVRQELLANGFRDVTVQPVSEKIVIIKTEMLDEKELERFKAILNDRFGDYRELRFESVGPTISRELVSRAYGQIVMVCLGILFYITYSFRKINQISKGVKISSWRLGIAAIVALVHDIVITIGVFVILGNYRGVEIDSLFVTALLTILGFSVHDTIVVFDRVRENFQIQKHKSFQSLIDYSVNSTLTRSINTSSTLIFVLVAMFLFGGVTIHNFVLALLVGVTVGTYSSIFIASPLLYHWRGNID